MSDKTIAYRRIMDGMSLNQLEELLSNLCKIRETNPCDPLLPELIGDAEVKIAARKGTTTPSGEMKIHYDLTECKGPSDLTERLGQHAFHHQSAAINVGVLYGLLSSANQGQDLRDSVGEFLRLGLGGLEC
jgi:hypothetical protein